MKQATKMEVMFHSHELHILVILITGIYWYMNSGLTYWEDIGLVSGVLLWLLVFYLADIVDRGS